MENLSSLSSFTEMQVTDREGLRRRFNLKRFREDLDNEAIEASIGAEGDREIEKQMIARHYGITRDRLSQIEQGQGGGPQRVVYAPAPAPAPAIVFKDDTDKRRLQQDLNQARANLANVRDEVNAARLAMENSRRDAKVRIMDAKELTRRWEDIEQTLGAIAGGGAAPPVNSKAVPLVAQED
jgi:hypothetical protein